MKMIHTIIYIFSIVLVNYGFTVVPLIPLPGGEMWPPMSLLVGFIFVIRDFAQRKIGHYVLIAMFFGGVISWFMAGQQVAVASITAFAVSEIIDWVIYSFTGSQFSDRILLSSFFSTPIDSAIFLGLIGLFSWSTILIMTISKMLGAVMVFVLIRKQEIGKNEVLYWDR